MKRRHYLAAVTTIALAGCSSNADPDNGSDPTENSTETEPDDDGDDNDVENGDNDPSDDDGTDENGAGVDDKGESETQGEPDEPDESDDGPSDDEIAADHIAEARDALDGAIDTYASFTGKLNATMRDVDATSPDVDPADLENSLGDATAELETASDLATDAQQKEIGALEETVGWLDRCAQLEAAWTDVYDAAGVVMDELHKEDLTAVASAVDNLEDELSYAHHRRALLDEVGHDRVRGAHIDASTVDSKIEQFDTDESTVSALTDAIDTLRDDDVLPVWTDSVATFIDEDYYNAESGFWSAERSFDGLEDADGEIAGPFAEFLEEIVCVAGAISNASGHLYEACQHYIDGDSYDGRDAVQDAQDELETCSDAEQFESVSRVLEYEPPR